VHCGKKQMMFNSGKSRKKARSAYQFEQKPTKKERRRKNKWRKRVEQLSRQNRERNKNLKEIREDLRREVIEAKSKKKRFKSRNIRKKRYVSLENEFCNLALASFVSRALKLAIRNPQKCLFLLFILGFAAASAFASQGCNDVEYDTCSLVRSGKQLCCNCEAELTELGCDDWLCEYLTCGEGYQKTSVNKVDKWFPIDCSPDGDYVSVSIPFCAKIQSLNLKVGFIVRIPIPIKKGNKIRIRRHDCLHRLGVLRAHEGAFYYKDCRITVTNAKLGACLKSFRIIENPDFCISTTKIAMNCKNGQIVCDIPTCKECFVEQGFNFTKKDGWAGEGLEDGICFRYAEEKDSAKGTATWGGSKKAPGERSSCSSDGEAAECTIVEEIGKLTWPIAAIVGLNMGILTKLTILPFEIVCLMRCLNRRPRPVYLVENLANLKKGKKQHQKTVVASDSIGSDEDV